MRKCILLCQAIIVLVILLMTHSNLFSQLPDYHVHHHQHDEMLSHQQKLWAKIDMGKIRREVAEATKISAKDEHLFIAYCYEKLIEIRNDFFQQASDEEAAESIKELYAEKIKLLFLNAYDEFVYVNNIERGKRSSGSGIVCNNSDFENGDLTGWKVGTADVFGCFFLSPCNVSWNEDPTRHFITDASAPDPFIPGLSAVAPGGMHSLRLENSLDGGQASYASYTFKVTPENNLFTYRYAVVLEDPGGSHMDSERPYFRVNMYDENGDKISCASYSALAKPPIDNFTLQRVTDPTSNTGFRELYYRDWTNISLPLVDYIGQEVTIEFIVADCAQGAHLGYAYIDAECSKVYPQPTHAVCVSRTGTLTASSGFASYSWTGPGIVGASNTASIVVNQAGTYTVTLTPFADVPCPMTMSVDVQEYCPVGSVDIELCESAGGSGIAAGVNLNDYSSGLIPLSSSITIDSWHSGRPPSAGNLITSINNMTIADGTSLYALLTITGDDKDTVEVKFKVNPLPIINFPPIPDFCAGSPIYQINGITPAGGTFSGQNVNASGIFDPSVSGSYVVKYIHTNNFGCKDSASVTVVVNEPASIDAGIDQTYCATGNIAIPLSGIVNNAASVTWDGGGGAFSSKHIVNSIYTPSKSDISIGSVILTLTAEAKSPCPNVIDQVTYTIVPSPEINAGEDLMKCTDDISPFNLAASVSNAASVFWSGGNGTFSNANSVNPVYTPASSEKESGPILLTLTVSGNSPCPNKSDQVSLTYVPASRVDAGPDLSICADDDHITLSGSSSHTTSLSWSGGGGLYSFSNPATVATYFPTKEDIAAGNVTISLIGTANAPCENVSDQMLLTINPLPEVNLKDEYVFCWEEEPGVTIDAGAHTKYLWTPTGDTTRAITVTDEATYTVMVSNEFNCSSKDQTVVKDICKPRIFLPNAFSPNGDGANDLYKVYGEHIGKFRMLIFNRWGEVIFETTSLEVEWDGVYRDKLMPFGLYPWIITYEGDSEEYVGPYSLEGSVTLLR